MRNGACKNCNNYSFYKMITNGPYGHAGEIPCEKCSRFSFTHDNYEPREDRSPYDTNISKKYMERH
jgi:hypothetical protein